jgi:hypothetical protein
METKNLVFTGTRFDWADISAVQRENEDLVTFVSAAVRKIRSAAKKAFERPQRGNETFEYDIR